MAFGKIFFRGICQAALLGIVWACCSVAAEAQPARTRVPDGRQGRPVPQFLSADANSGDEPGMAAGRLIDSLFNPNAPESPVPEIVSEALGRSPYQGAAARSSLRGRLVRNPDTDNGSAPFVLVDRYGGIRRYIEPVSDIDLEMYEGEIVAVRRDTGDTLLASQLELPRQPGNGQRLQLAGHEEPIPAGEPIPELAAELTDEQSPLVIPEGIDPVYLDDEFGQEDCPSCGGLALHGPGCGQCVRGRRNRFYVLGEYLLWAVDGMDIPPLVVAGESQVIGGESAFVNAQIIYGNEEILTQGRSGARLRLGVWLGGGPWALEGEYLGLAKVSSSFTAGDDTIPFEPPYIGRPFIDATSGLDAVEDVYFPPDPPGLDPDPGITGTVTVTANSELGSGGIWFRRSLCTIAGCQQECCDEITCDSGVGCGAGVGRCGTGRCGRWFSRCCNKFREGTRRTDFLFGIRTARLRENLAISENLLTDDGLTTFQVNDQFSTTNDFTGLEIGYLSSWQHRRWSLDLQTRLALGGTRQQVDIRGRTVEGGEPGEGGLLALPSNIGSYDRNEFSVLPQLGATLGFAITQRLRLTAGYNFFYISRVVRPGDQIDLEVNPDLLPFAGVDPPIIPARPRFDFRATDLWAQGLSVGVDYRW